MDEGGADETDDAAFGGGAGATALSPNNVPDGWDTIVNPLIGGNPIMTPSLAD